jgi:hypothetical protein
MLEAIRNLCSLCSDDSNEVDVAIRNNHITVTVWLCPYADEEKICKALEDLSKKLAKEGYVNNFGVSKEDCSLVLAMNMG